MRGPAIQFRGSGFELHHVLERDLHDALGRVRAEVEKMSSITVDTPDSVPVIERERRHGAPREHGAPGRIRYHSDVTTLVRAERDDDHLENLGARLIELEALLGTRTTEVDAARSGLEAFRLRYRQEVGLLHEQLDALELAIAEAELGELAKKSGDAASPGADVPCGTRPDPAPRFTSDAVRKLFRDVAKTIHPDLARDHAARERRHALMIEANKAYARGDEAQLRWILDAWERSPESVQGIDAESTRLRLVRRIAQVEEQLQLLDADLAALKDTPLWELKTMVDQAAVRGKDIVKDMVRRLQRDIMAATNRLDAMRPPG